MKVRSLLLATVVVLSNCLSLTNAANGTPEKKDAVLAQENTAIDKQCLICMEETSPNDRSLIQCSRCHKLYHQGCYRNFVNHAHADNTTAATRVCPHCKNQSFNDVLPGDLHKDHHQLALALDRARQLAEQEALLRMNLCELFQHVVRRELTMLGSRIQRAYVQFRADEVFTWHHLQNLLFKGEF